MNARKFVLRDVYAMHPTITSGDNVQLTEKPYSIEQIADGQICYVRPVQARCEVYLRKHVLRRVYRSDYKGEIRLIADNHQFPELSIRLDCVELFPVAKLSGRKGVAEIKAPPKWCKKYVAELIVRKHFADIRWCPFPRKWLIRTNGVWGIDKGFETYRRLRFIITELLASTRELGDTEGQKYLCSLRDQRPLQALLAGT